MDRGVEIKKDRPEGQVCIMAAAPIARTEDKETSIRKEEGV